MIAFLMSVLYSLADLNKEFEAAANPQLLRITVLRNGRSLHKLHHEIRMAGLRGRRVENSGNVGMIQ